MTDSPTSKDRLRAMLEMYGWLREEINQSNQLQHRILLGFATFVGLVFGLEFSGTLSEFANATPATFRFVLGAILPIVVVAPGIWLVEQSRVMMAGNYLQLLEHKVHDEVGNAPVAWENWLRWDGEKVTAAGRLDAQSVYSRGYFVGYVGFFGVIGSLTVGLFWVRVFAGTADDGTVLAALAGQPLAALYLLLWSGLLVLTLYYAVEIVHHSDHSIEVDTLDAFEQANFERATFERPVSLADAFADHDARVADLGVEADDDEGKFEELLDLAERRGNHQGT